MTSPDARNNANDVICDEIEIRQKYTW